jgi:hypothetical protein
MPPAVSGPRGRAGKLTLHCRAKQELLEDVAHRQVVFTIPKPSQQMTRYWGFYANAARGKRRKAGEQEAGARPALAGEDAVDTFTRQARLSGAKLTSPPHGPSAGV